MPPRPSELQNDLHDSEADLQHENPDTLADLVSQVRGTAKQIRHAAANEPAQPDPNSTLRRHSRKCKICHHPDCDMIEADFLEWRNPQNIASSFKVAYSAIYRHARAFGLIERRRENLSSVVDKVLEQVEYIETPSAFAILRAVRTLACLTGARNWTEPPTTHVVVNTTTPPVSSPDPIGSTEPPAHSASPVTNSDALVSAEADPVVALAHSGPGLEGVQHSNRHTYEKLEPAVTLTKQSPDLSSNRHENAPHPRCAPRISGAANDV